MHMSSIYSSQSTLCSEKSLNNGQSVNTFLRIRPCNERSENYEIFKNSLIIRKSIDRNEKKYIYSFNSIFDEGIQQEDFFFATTSPLVKEFLLGKNNLIFSYGITSSGKSYTMRGTNDSPGLIPFSLISIFHQISAYVPSNSPQQKIFKFCDVKNLDEKQSSDEKAFHDELINEKIYKHSDEILSGIHNDSFIQSFEKCFEDSLSEKLNEKFYLWISFFEIYNERFYDLLKPGTETQVVTSEKNFYLKDVTQVYVTSAVEAFAVFLRGQQNLHMDSTTLNEASSRSHSVFTLSLLRINQDTKDTSISKLCFADLAGIERLKKIGMNKLTETTNINKSLMTLSRCIQELKNKSSIVPVRESNLTKVFQPYLINTGGKMSLIYNLNPSKRLFEESSNSLDFCKASQKINQKEIEEFKKYADIQRDKSGFENIRRSLSILNNTTNQEVIDSLREQLDQKEQLISQLESDKNEIYEKAQNIIDNSTKRYKRKIEMLEEDLRVMDEMYKEKLEELKKENKKVQQELFDALEKNSELEEKFSEIEKRNVILEEQLRCKANNIKHEAFPEINETLLSQNGQDKALKTNDENISPENDETKPDDAPQPNKYPLSSTMLSSDMTDSLNYQTPVKRKRGLQDDSIVQTYLASAKKAQQQSTFITPNNSRLLRQIELPKTAQKRLAINTSVSDVQVEIAEADGSAQTKMKIPYNTRSRKLRK